MVLIVNVTHLPLVLVVLTIHCVLYYQNYSVFKLKEFITETIVFVISHSVEVVKQTDIASFQKFVVMKYAQNPVPLAVVLLVLSVLTVSFGVVLLVKMVLVAPKTIVVWTAKVLNVDKTLIVRVR